MKPVYREDESIGGHEDWCSCRQCERERPSAGVRHQFAVGEQIEAWVSSEEWRAGTISRLEPYRGRPGYYVIWSLPLDAPSWVSRGGWKPENCVRVKQ